MVTALPSDEESGPGSVLAVMAHPDDAELWAGGTLALHTRAGSPTAIAVPTCDRVRDADAAAGAAILGADLRILPTLTATAIAGLITEVRPQVLITHSDHDVHPDHRHAGLQVLQALPNVVIATGHPRRVYACDTYNSLTLHGPVWAGAIVDISAVWDQKMRALRAHRSQPITGLFGPMADNLARLWGARVGAAYAENFTPIPVLGRLPASRHL